MRFSKVLNEYRNFDIHAVNTKKEIKKNKFELLKACGLEATFDYAKDELYVVNPKTQDVINIYDDTSSIRFSYKTPELKEKWKLKYKKIFETHSKRLGEERGEPSDFLIKPNLRKKIEAYGWSFYEFIAEMSKDINVGFVPNRG